jgi:hypothetical protein
MFGIGSSFGTKVNDFLGIFGVRGAGIGIAIDSLTGNSTGVLTNLHDQYLETALGRGTGPIDRMIGCGWGGIPPTMMMPQPFSVFPTMAPFVGGGYAGVQQVDLAPGSSNIPFLSKLIDPNRRAAGRFERMLRGNPYARAAFEAQVGGRIVDFGLRDDGKFVVQRFSPGFAPVPGMSLNPMATLAFSALAPIQQVANMAFGGLGMMNPFPAFFAAGLGGMQAPLGGLGMGSWNPLAMPGRINNTNPMYEQAHQLQVDSVLRDPSLTVEDKVTLMIMLIMNKMDQDVERQAQYINSIQQQQSNRGGGGGGKGKGGGGKGFMGIGKGKGGAGGAAGGQQSPSIDVETMKLKRMIDKRSQMFDMLRQIIDKYNQTAKGIIDSIGR